ncbi:MAG TPA: Gfo/Idh/MocA family oxidoreductase [Lacipirellula sp.]
MSPDHHSSLRTQVLRAGMVGMGMIFDETYRPFFETVRRRPLFDRAYGVCEVELSAVATRTGTRAEAYRERARSAGIGFTSFAGDGAIEDLLRSDVNLVCIATPDDRHFFAAKAALKAGKHVLIEKPSVLQLAELDELQQLAHEQNVLAKVVYHKLLDPDHKKLRTLAVDGMLQHVNNGYCSLLEPKSIAGSQFAEWITGRNPGTYVAVHYIKLIDFTFGLKLKRVSCTGQRGIVGPAEGPTWDSTQLRLIYAHEDGREAAFDIHTSWVTPDNFPGYVEQEVQFRFDNGVWNGHSRKRGVECTVEGATPLTLKNTLNNHYNAAVLEPWGERAQRGYGVEVIERFMREVAQLDFSHPPEDRPARLQAARRLSYNDLDSDRQVVAAVQAMEAILARHAAGAPECTAEVNGPLGGLVLQMPGQAEPEILYAPAV